MANRNLASLPALPMLDNVRCSDCKLKQRNVLITGGLRGAQFSNILGKEKIPSLFKFSSENLYTSFRDTISRKKNGARSLKRRRSLVANPRSLRVSLRIIPLESACAPE